MLAVIYLIIIINGGSLLRGYHYTNYYTILLLLRVRLQLVDVYERGKDRRYFDSNAPSVCTVIISRWGFGESGVSAAQAFFRFKEA